MLTLREKLSSCIELTSVSTAHCPVSFLILRLPPACNGAHPNALLRRAAQPWPGRPPKARQSVRIDLMLKIACHVPFPDQRAAAGEVGTLNFMFSSYRLTASWWGACRAPDPNSIEIPGCRQWLGQDPIPVQLEEPCYFLFH
jgi:hypothetical protein